MRPLFLLLFLSVGGACHDGAHRALQDRVLHRGQPGEPHSLDPQLVDDDFSLNVVRDLYEGLTAEDVQGRIGPGVADSWRIDEAHTTYTFHLRQDARWSNGDPIIADEFVRGIRRAIAPSTASGAAGLLAIIRGASEIIAGRRSIESLAVVATAPDELKIELEHPAPYFLQILSQPIAAPLHEGATDPSKSGKPLPAYNGAYVLATRVPGSLIDLSLNPFYWGISGIGISHVRYVNVESEETEMREYLAGQIDITYSIPIVELERMRRERSAEVQVAQSLGVSYLALNLSAPPLKDNADLRKALSIAVDRELISHNLLGGASAAYSFVPESVTNYEPASYVWRLWNRQRQLEYAESLYKRAGYSRSNPLHLRLYSSSNETIHQTMIAIAEGWRQNLGIETTLVEEEFRVFLAGRKDRSRWDVLRQRWDADFDDVSNFLEIFSTGTGQNDSGYSNAKVDELLAKARAAADPATRAAIYKSVEQIILEDNPVIPIYFPLVRRLVNPEVSGAERQAITRTYSKNLSWKLGSR